MSKYNQDCEITEKGSDWKSLKSKLNYILGKKSKQNCTVTLL